METGGSIISDIGTPGYPEKEREQTKMLNWAQSEVFNWAPAEYSIMIKLKGSPYYHDYVDQGTILDRVVGSSRVRNIENISVPLELTCFFGSKTLRLIPFFEQNFHFLDQMVLFLDLDCQNLASLDFDNCPISKKDHLISEMKISLSEMKLRLRVFPPQSKSIPEVQNIYSLCYVIEGLKTAINGVGTIGMYMESITRIMAILMISFLLKSCFKKLENTWFAGIV